MRKIFCMPGSRIAEHGKADNGQRNRDNSCCEYQVSRAVHIAARRYKGHMATYFSVHTFNNSTRVRADFASSLTTPQNISNRCPSFLLGHRFHDLLDKNEIA